MREEHLVEFLQYGGFFVKVGTSYRPLCDTRDSSGQPIDLGYNLYRRENGRWRLYLPGPHGDKPSPHGVTMPPERPSDHAVQDAIDTTNAIYSGGRAVLRGCCLVYAVLAAITFFFGLLTLIFGTGVR